MPCLWLNKTPNYTLTVQLHTVNSRGFKCPKLWLDQSFRCAGDGSAYQGNWAFCGLQPTPLLPWRQQRRWSPSWWSEWLQHCSSLHCPMNSLSRIHRRPTAWPLHNSSNRITLSRVTLHQTQVTGILYFLYNCHSIFSQSVHEICWHG